MNKNTLRTEKTMFAILILSILIGYIGITIWLNAVRVTAPIWLAWALAIVQFILYCLIFSFSYLRSKVCGLKRFSFIIFSILLVLGRINDWELLVIPMLIITMLIVSAKAKNTETDWMFKVLFQRELKNIK